MDRRRTNGAREMMHIHYKEGYKYQLAESYAVLIDIKPAAAIKTKYVRLSVLGELWIREGYAWDGPSGPAIDTSNFMRGSLIHDALYQLLREGLLPQDMRETADKTLRRIVLEDGMSAIRAWLVYQGVRIGGGPAALPSSDTSVLRAP